MAHLQPMIRFQRHYRHQLDNKNRLIYDLLCRQRVYLARLRDFICRIPSELRRQAHEKLMESLEHLELNFNDSQEEFYHLQNVIKNLEAGPDCDFDDLPPSPPMTAPSSSSCSSFGPLSASPSSSSASVTPRKRQRKAAEASVCLEAAQTATAPTSAPMAKRRRRKGSRVEEAAAGRLRAASPPSKAVVPRPCSSSSENANSPPSPMSTPQGSACSSSSSSSSSSSNSNGSLAALGRWSQAKAQNASSTFNQLTPKSMVTDMEFCPNEDNILPDFSLFG